MLFHGPCLLLCGPYYIVLLYCTIIYSTVLKAKNSRRQSIHHHRSRNYKWTCAPNVNHWHTKWPFASASVMFPLLYSITNEELHKNCLCNQSQNYNTEAMTGYSQCGSGLRRGTQRRAKVYNDKKLWNLKVQKTDQNLCVKRYLLQIWSCI